MKLKREGGSEVTLTARRLFTHAHTLLHTANTQTITDAALSIDFLLISIAGETSSEGEDISPSDSAKEDEVRFAILSRRRAPCTCGSQNR